MRQLSSSWTLILRIFLPTIWLAFFGTFFLTLMFTNRTDMGSFSTSYFKMGLLAFVVIFLVVFYNTLFRLKRVDADKEFLYVTNYFKNVRYPHADVDKIELSKGFLFHYGTMFLKGKGSFGDKIIFIVSRKRLELFIEDNADLKNWIVEM